ncbi:MAG: hypothetical protein OM95_11230 [Bdellovibrio sp. ArHS]|nr:MAG: hypothetical protein OM95_11230 [Bdellovibrio sp. ArHS]
MIWLALFFWGSVAISAEGTNDVIVPSGTFQLLFQDKGESASRIGRLKVNRTPVTNAQFLAFVKAQPEWSRSKVKPLYADGSYLKKWNGDLSFDSKFANFPVVNISWFAARAYCKSRGQRLPTIAEWEYFSDAQNPQAEAETLRWYAKGQEDLRGVGLGKPNKFGLHDTAGLVWEWVEDFSSAIMPGDSREGPARDMFCGGAALNAKNPKQYAAFMRYALRSSLRAQYTTSSLGFRCVQDF